jgi:hypothetical protein
MDTYEIWDSGNFDPSDYSLDDHTHNIIDLPSGIVSPPTNLVLTEATDYVTVSFTKATGNIDYYEVYSSVGDADSYALISKINHSDFIGSVSIQDNTYNKQATVYYRVYAYYNGQRSVALTDNITITNDTPDITNLRVQAGVGTFHLTWDLPEDPRFVEVNVFVDYDTVDTNLAKPVTPIYSGNVNSFDYAIPSAYLDYYHQFWVEAVTRT